MLGSKYLRLAHNKSQLGRVLHQSLVQAGSARLYLGTNQTLPAARVRKHEQHRRQRQRGGGKCSGINPGRVTPRRERTPPGNTALVLLSLHNERRESRAMRSLPWRAGGAGSPGLRVPGPLVVVVLWEPGPAQNRTEPDRARPGTASAEPDPPSPGSALSGVPPSRERPGPGGEGPAGAGQGRGGTARNMSAPGAARPQHTHTKQNPGTRARGPAAGPEGTPAPPFLP